MAVAQVILAYSDRDKSATATSCFYNNYQNSFLPSTEQGKCKLCEVLSLALLSQPIFLHVNSYTICFVIFKPSRWQKVQGFLTSVLFLANNFKVTIYKFTSTTLLVKMILYSKGIKIYGLGIQYLNIQFFKTQVYHTLVAVFQCLVKL